MKSAEPTDLTATRAQIEKILNSQALANKHQLRKLLEFLTQNIDSQTSLKPDRVIRELWPTEIQTKKSADVAKEINRLRDILEIYYSAEGKDDPIRITLPNRSKPGADGLPEKRWIAAHPRDEHSAQGSSPLAPQSRTALRSRIRNIVAIIASLVAILGALAYLSLHSLLHDRPYAGRIDATTLAILDADGKELWRKSFSEGFSSEYYQQGLANRIWIGDLEGNGQTDILFLYHPSVTPTARSTTLVCYSDRGREKWRWTPGKELPELQGTPSSYRTDGLAVLKAKPGDPARRIVVASGHSLYYPYQIALVDSHGKTISEYWHSGQINHFTVGDPDGSGAEEIFAAGISNGYHQATLVVLDPDRVFGASTEAARPEIQLHGMGVAQEKIRLLFPRSDLNVALSTYNDAQEAVVKNGRIRIPVRECLQLPGCTIGYEFDQTFRLLSVEIYDQFRSAHKEFYLRSETGHPFSQEEEAQFRKVRCLVGCDSEFVGSDIH